MKKILPAVLIIVVVAICFYVLYFYKKPVQEDPLVKKTYEGVIKSAKFGCADNKSIQAIFFKDRVELSLSDGRNMLLSQAVSASGARYANADESFVFWNKGDTAFVDEGSATTFKDCSVVPTAEDVGTTSQQ